jgi:hypothetical protein
LSRISLQTYTLATTRRNNWFTLPPLAQRRRDDLLACSVQSAERLQESRTASVLLTTVVPVTCFFGVRISARAGGGRRGDMQADGPRLGAGEEHAGASRLPPSLLSSLCSLRTLCLSFRFLQSGGAGCTPATLVARLKAQHVPGWNLQVQGAHQVRCMSEASV